MYKARRSLECSVVRSFGEKIAAIALAYCVCLTLAACADGDIQKAEEGVVTAAPTITPDAQAEQDQTQEEATEMKMKVSDTPVSVAWEENGSVEALKALCAHGPLTIDLHRYGGFEQVGGIGASLPRNDIQTTTQAGDIVLYSGNQIVVFYGSNSWAYTRLGRITDQTADGMRALLANGDVTVTITAE